MMVFCLLCGCTTGVNSSEDLLKLNEVQEFLNDNFDAPNLITYSESKYGTTLDEGVSLSVQVDSLGNVCEMDLGCSSQTEKVLDTFNDFIVCLPQIMSFTSEELEPILQFDCGEVRLENEEAELVFVNDESGSLLLRIRF